MTTELEKYAWVSAALGEAACVTVVAEADETKVAKAFGCDPPLETVPENEAGWGTELVLAVSGNDVVVVEDNGWEGSRSAVLRVASKAGATGLAASVYWNVNGRETFTAARKGTLVCSVELMDCDPDDLPRELRKIAARAGHEETDLVALAAAMIEKFTGTSFGEDALTRSVRRTYTAAPDDLETINPKTSLLRDYTPQLWEAIMAATP